MFKICFALYSHSEKFSEAEKQSEKKCESQSETQPESSSDTYVYNEIEKLIQGFFSMFPKDTKCPMNPSENKTTESQAAMETEDSSQDEDHMGCEFLDAPPEAAKIGKEEEEPVRESSPGTSSKSNGQNPGPSEKNASKKRVIFNIPADIRKKKHVKHNKVDSEEKTQRKISYLF